MAAKRCPLRAFSSAEFGTIRILTIDGSLWFVSKDVATALGYSDPTDAVKKYCHGRINLWIGMLTEAKKDGSSDIRPIGMDFIPEHDLYLLAARSKFPAAEKFENWIKNEVIPVAFKKGGRIINQVLMLPTEIMATAVLTAQKIIEGQKAQIAALIAVNKELKSKLDS